MAIKVGINGFGRIGRVALRIMVERGSSTYQICGINLRLRAQRLNNLLL